MNYKHFAVIIIFTFRPRFCGIMRNLFPQIAQNNPTLLPAFQRIQLHFIEVFLKLRQSHTYIFWIAVIER